MANLEELEKRVSAIEARNRRVEADKAWETSLTRRFLITALTYFLIAFSLIVIKNTDPWINAIIPSVGFLISTLVFSWAKRRWLNNR